VTSGTVVLVELGAATVTGVFVRVAVASGVFVRVGVEVRVRVDVLVGVDVLAPPTVVAVGVDVRVPVAVAVIEAWTVGVSRCSAGSAKPIKGLAGGREANPPMSKLRRTSPNNRVRPLGCFIYLLHDVDP
jgi:hypothetical protein